MWTLARLTRECARYGIDVADAIDVFGLSHTYDGVAAAEWLGAL